MINTLISKKIVQHGILVRDIGYSKKEIIKMLSGDNHLSYTEIKHKLGITDNAVSKHLKTLLQQNTIELRKKDKKYTLTKNAKSLIDSKLSIISKNYNDFFYSSMHDNQYDDFNKFIEHIEKNLGACFLFALLKSYKTGTKWFSLIDSKDLFDVMTDYTTSMITNSFKHKDIEYVEKILSKINGARASDEFFKGFSNMIKKNKEFQEKLNEFDIAFNNRYYEEMKFLDIDRYGNTKSFQ